MDQAALEERLAKVEAATSGRLPAYHGLPSPPRPSAMATQIAEAQEAARQRREAAAAAEAAREAAEAQWEAERQRQLWLDNTEAREEALAELVAVDAEYWRAQARARELRARRRELRAVIEVGIPT